MMYFKEAADMGNGEPAQREAAFEYAERASYITSVSTRHYVEKAFDDLQHASSFSSFFDRSMDRFSGFLSNKNTSQSSGLTAIHYYQIAVKLGHKPSAIKLIEMHNAPSSNNKLEPTIARDLGVAYLHGNKQYNIEQDLSLAKSFLDILGNNSFIDAVKNESGAFAYRAANHFYTSNPNISKELHQIAVEKEYTPAVLEKDAWERNLDAAFKLSSLHKYGSEMMSLPVDLQKATYFLNMATAGGHEGALLAQCKGDNLMRSNFSYEIGNSLGVDMSSRTTISLTELCQVGINIIRDVRNLAGPWNTRLAKFVFELVVQGGGSALLIDAIKKESPESTYQAATLFESNPSIFNQLHQMAVEKKYEPAVLETAAFNGDIDAAGKILEEYAFTMTNMEPQVYSSSMKNAVPNSISTKK
jgi:TPR repeat protein